MKKITLMLTLLLLLVGCGREDMSNMEAEFDAEIETEVPEAGETEADTAEPVIDRTKYAADAGDGLVSDGYVLELTDPFDGSVSALHLPRFNIGTAMAEDLNNTIAEQYFQKYAYYIDDLENGKSPYRMFQVSYDWADCGDVIAVVISDTSFVGGSGAGGTRYEAIYYNKITDDTMDMNAFLEWYTDGEYNLETLAAAATDSGVLTDLDGVTHSLTAEEIEAILPHPETGTFTCRTSLRVMGLDDSFVMPDSLEN
ncbi:MAG: hypothetical protein IJY35_12455 [Clostridia bacterium]|nr:hypothetical protein [Clostridia bacterium]